MILFKKTIHFTFILFVSFTLFGEVFLDPAEAGTPHIIYGNVVDAEGSIPSDGSVKFKVYVSERPDEILTESDTGCGYEDGWWWVETGNFPSPWSVGEVLITDTGNEKTSNIILNGNGSQELSLSVSVSEEEPGDDIIADYNGFRGGSDSGSRPRVSVLQSSGRTFRKNGTFRGDRYAGRPVRIVPERTDLPFCHLIISGGCALP